MVARLILPCYVGELEACAGPPCSLGCPAREHAPSDLDSFLANRRVPASPSDDAGGNPDTDQPDALVVLTARTHAHSPLSVDTVAQAGLTRTIPLTSSFTQRAYLGRRLSHGPAPTIDQRPARVQRTVFCRGGTQSSANASK